MLINSFLGILPLRAPFAARLCVAASALSLAASAASLNVYVSAPSAQSTFVTGATTETFNSLSTGIHTAPFTSVIGTYEFSSSAPMAVVAANQYGGANNSRYIALGAESHSSAPVTLSLSKAANYFGFWWSAGDTNNGLSFYYNSTFITRLTTADIIGILGGRSGHVTALDGAAYTSSSYYGNPNTGQDASEPFSYVNVFASNTAFNRIVFDNSGMSSSGFETDNHSVALASLTPQGSSVFVESAPATAVALSPEPKYLSAFGGACFALSLFLSKRRKA